MTQSAQPIGAVSASKQIRGLLAEDRPPTHNLADVLAGLCPAPSGTDGPMAIAEAADALQVSAHTLRYYERAGLIDIPRDGNGHRQFDNGAIGRAAFITRLRVSGMPIRAIKAYIELVNEGDSTIEERRDMLQRHREAMQAEIEELQFSLAVVDYKLATYRAP